jgi:hypothetical protein
MKSAVIAVASLAAMFGWTPAFSATSLGNVGTLSGTNGDITAPPTGSTYSYVGTNGGLFGAGQIDGAGGSNGSEYITDLFSANGGDALDFYFNYITSDGAGFSDYAFAELLDVDGAHVVYLFTARTVPSGDTSPGFSLPANSSTLTPESSPILAGTNFSPLGIGSGDCYNSGCGHTGWIESTFTISTTGSYKLRLGVTNIGDGAYDSALAFAGVTVAGNALPMPSNDVPEPASWAMMVAGFGLAGGMMRHRRAKIRFA